MAQPAADDGGGHETPKTSKSITFFTVNDMAFRHVEIPYETNGKWSFFGVKIEKGVENHQKSITYTTFSYRVFRTSKNLIKPMENEVFQNAKRRCKIPYKTCRL